MGPSARSVAVALAVLGVGCGMIAGLATEYGYEGSPRPDAAAHDTGLADGGGDGSKAADVIEAVDTAVPDDVVYADANEEPPPPADAACVPPATCGKSSPCCAPAVCSGANTCVKSCVGNVQRPCKTDLDCCQGLHCDENFYCVASCVSENGGDCQSLTVTQTCCPGLVCPDFGQDTKCQTCKNGNATCQRDWECCSKDCQQNGHCR